MSTLTLHDDEVPSSSVSQLTQSRPQRQDRADSAIFSPADSRARHRVIVVLVVLAFVCLGAALLYHAVVPIGADAPARVWHRVLSLVLKQFAGHSLVPLAIYPFAVLFIFMLERWFPAVPTQKTLSPAVFHDVLWALISGGFEFLVLNSYIALLYKVYMQHLSFLTLPVPNGFPVVLRLAIGAVIVDLLRWTEHWLHHHLVFLWPFHAVHHSQPELNLFSNSRIHFMELLISSTMVVIPLLILNVQQPTMIWWMLLLTWYARLYHANIKTNFGPLRYILVTPQSHRVHHSKLPEHFDQNFGAILSIWDHLFGTQQRDYDVYPVTGVSDDNFPIEQNVRSLLGLLTSPLMQMLYPFRRLWIPRHPAAVASLKRSRRPVR